MFRFTLTEEIDVRYPLAVAVPDQPNALPSGMAALGLLIIPAWVVKASINPAQQQMDKRTFMVRVSDPDYPDSEPTVKPEGQLFPEIFMVAVARNTSKLAEQPAAPLVHTVVPTA